MSNAWMLAIACGACAGVALAEESSFSLARPLLASMPQTPESVYAPPAPPREDEGVNEGAVSFQLAIRYMTDSVYRGVDRSEYIGLIPDEPGLPPPDKNVTGAEDRPNLQVEARLDFDLGKLPHPYLGVFANVFNADPTSRFQEIRPYFGLEWTLKPFIFDFGHQTFILPDREDDNTSEVYARITLDDRRIFRTERPVLSPYVYAAYDYDLYQGWYFEAGVRHVLPLDDFGITLTFLAAAAYVSRNDFYQLQADGDNTGFQHYDLGLIGNYSLNHALNISRRYGEFGLEGYLMYTDKINDDLRADRQVWGGAGITFKY